MNTNPWTEQTLKESSLAAEHLESVESAQLLFQDKLTPIKGKQICIAQHYKETIVRDSENSAFEVGF